VPPITGLHSRDEFQEGASTRKPAIVFAITHDELVNMYGGRPQVRKLLGKLRNSRSTQERLDLLLRFDEDNWIEMTSPTLAAGLPSLGGTTDHPPATLLH